MLNRKTFFLLFFLYFFIYKMFLSLVTVLLFISLKNCKYFFFSFRIIVWTFKLNHCNNVHSHKYTILLRFKKRFYKLRLKIMYKWSHHTKYYLWRERIKSQITNASIYKKKTTNVVNVYNLMSVYYFKWS